MLKIKDDVDLKVLEKFGFVNKNKDEYVYKEEIRCSDEYGVSYSRLYVNKIYRSISLDNEVDFNYPMVQYFEDDNNIFLNIIFDLIQAGLVEEVE